MYNAATIKYEDSGSKVEGTPERPKRTGNAWHIDRLDPVNKATLDGRELFFLTQSVAGTWERADGLEEYQAVYVPRPSDWPPIQKVTLKYLDKDGSMQDAPEPKADEGADLL